MSVTNSDTDSGIPHGTTLNAFAEAVLGDDDTALEAARGKVLQEMGEAALIDSAGVVATFMQMDRIADAAGIPMPNERVEPTREMCSGLGFYNYASAQNTPGARE